MVKVRLDVISDDIGNYLSWFDDREGIVVFVEKALIRGGHQFTIEFPEVNPLTRWNFGRLFYDTPGQYTRHKVVVTEGDLSELVKKMEGRWDELHNDGNPYSWEELQKML